MDRNRDKFVINANFAMSLSARRAWIEIRSIVYNSASGWSLSARRAWIEISCGVYNMERLPVALRKESVDRNKNGNG